MWSLPALLLGAILRALLLSYLPLGYWGTDSKSYYGLAHRLLTEGVYENEEKRRYLYPLLMVPVSMLPGVPMRWLVWLQHGAGLLSVLPLAYVVRRTMHGWKAWILPITFLYAMHPMFLWYEHELLGETVFFMGFAWAFGGWVAWISQADPRRARRLFWWFLLPLAAFLLTKPAGRFVLPGLVFGLLTVRAWRVLRWPQWAAFVLLSAVTFKVGSGKQGAWLLYTASFPLTQLDTPLHADYKKDIREMVIAQSARLDLHYTHSRAAMEFLDSPSENGGSPLWAALDKNPEEKRKLYMSLALEGIKARPLDYAYLSLQRLTASSNMSAFEEARFISTYYPTRFEKLYEEARKLVAEAGKRQPPLALAFGFRRGEPLPPYSEFRARLAPRAETWMEHTVLAVARGYESISDFVKIPTQREGATDDERSFSRTTVTPLGWWLLASLALSLLRWRTLGVWTTVAVGYVCAVYMCALVQARFFLPAWLVIFPVLFVPLDLLARALSRKRTVPTAEAGRPTA